MRVHMEEEQSPVLWLWSKAIVSLKCSVPSFILWNCSPFVGFATKDSLDAEGTFMPGLQKFAVNKANHLLPWINISSDKLKMHFSGVHYTPSHKTAIVVTVIALAFSETSVYRLIAGIQIPISLTFQDFKIGYPKHHRHSLFVSLGFLMRLSLEAGNVLNDFGCSDMAMRELWVTSYIYFFLFDS